MDAITRNCLKIEELNISGCSGSSRKGGSVTDSGFRGLAALPNLFDLTMSYMGNMPEAALEAVARKGKLRKLVCRGCPTLTDDVCISVITSCDELELFDLSGCNLVTIATVQAALDSVKLRTNGVKLTLVVGYTSVCRSAAVEKNPLLEVDLSDLCIHRLRPDFNDNYYPPLSDDDDDDDDDERYYSDDPNAYLNIFAHKE
ncbi:F-box/LRR-repeat protein 2-like isoform X2 [Zootermopsis nevadensis]|uniref:F-box/LRR-repeat protein 2-like isoform X2 n=1 Tax=Zootermopsis nevadensis TaxID=136037 RepID=UPI000B8E550C|nr:F-box/LRR-repeat protein 2-like isoform X2 [Zootermopsis nevadensis]